MKKLLLGIALLIASVFSYGQDSVTIKIPDTSKLTVAKVYNDVKTGLSGLAAGLKVGAEHVYVVLIKQQVVSAIVYLIVGGFSLLFLTLFFKGLSNKEEKWVTNYDEPTGLGIFRIISAIVGVICFLFFIFNLNEIITGFVNPEYGAIKEIIRLKQE